MRTPLDCIRVMLADLGGEDHAAVLRERLTPSGDHIARSDIDGARSRPLPARR